mmetsp:Transcript_24467/g.68735  ORF Transcript_24467/g.68735 Transcript_24467/m.68735 type:complete len:444 (-) Transcript_24467:335-1666(-)
MKAPMLVSVLLMAGVRIDAAPHQADDTSMTCLGSPVTIKVEFPQPQLGADSCTLSDLDNMGTINGAELLVQGCSQPEHQVCRLLSDGGSAPKTACRPSANVGDACDGTRPCDINTYPGAPALWCSYANDDDTAGTCALDSRMSDKCAVDADCGNAYEASCIKGVCSGALREADPCTSGGSCGLGLYCGQAGVCEATRKTGDLCRGYDDECGRFADCNTLESPPRCTVWGAAADGTKADFHMLCESFFTNQAGECSHTRDGAPVGTGGACTSDSNCTSIDDECACHGTVVGTCQPVNKEVYDVSRRMFACGRAAGCEGDGVSFSGASCLYEHCNLELRGYFCASAVAAIRKQHNGADLGGADGAAFKALMNSQYACDSLPSAGGPGGPGGGGMSPGAVAGIIVGTVAVVATAVAATLVRRRRRGTAGTRDPEAVVGPTTPLMNE